MDTTRAVKAFRSLVHTGKRALRGDKAVCLERNQKILSRVNLSGPGLEIGPSINPVVPKSENSNVHSLDHMSQENLRDKYRDHPGIDISKIEPVDYVWSGERFKDLTGKDKYFEWIIASHVIEHTPDLIGFLIQCDEILKDDGVLSLVVPDKRYCFDHFRPTTGIAKVIDAFEGGATIHSPGTVYEYYLNVVAKAGAIAWAKDSDSGEFTFVHSKQDAIKALGDIENNKYVDVHSWCFTPHSFRMMIHDLHELGFIPFQEVCFFETEGCEFFVTLGRDSAAPKKSRMEYLEEIHRELGSKG